MKKIYIVMAVLATAALASCQQEESFEEGKMLKDNDVVFAIKSVATRSSEVIPEVRYGAVMQIENEISDVKLFLEETIEDLGTLAAEPETKGTPAYTENVGKLYESMRVYAAEFGTENYDKTDETMVDGGWRYNHTYSSDTWPKPASTTVDFYMRMPATQAGVTPGENDNAFHDSAYTYGKNGGQQTITFSYTSPTTAAGQEDILFAARPISSSDHIGSLPGGVRVLFNHALTAVKFAIANPDEAAITSITFNGLYDTGTCVITPASESDYKDVTDNYSSATAAVWSSLDKTGNSISSGTYGNPINYTTGNFGDKGNYPESFAKTANKNNLNKTDGSQTFWLIPQTVPEDATLTIAYTYKNQPGEATLEFGKALRMKGGDLNMVWNAGELRTYTLKVDEVNVKIDDSMDVKGTANNGHSGSIKDQVTITNTGNTNAFIRASLVGQWWSQKEGYDPTKPEIVFGFTDAVGRLDVVESWYEDQFVSTAVAKHGTFVGLPGYKNTSTFKPDTESEGETNGWYLCEDDYYYYSKPVEPNKTTTALFDSYTVGTPPTPTYGGQVWQIKDIYFTLEIATQAISANNPDGSTKNWADAWEEATGVKPVQK